MSELYSIETIAKAFGFDLDYTRRRLREHVKAVESAMAHNAFAFDTRPSWERVRDGEVAPNAGLDPLGASLAEREG